MVVVCLSKAIKPICLTAVPVKFEHNKNPNMTCSRKGIGVKFVLKMYSFHANNRIVFIVFLNKIPDKKNRAKELYRGPVYFILSNIDAFGETKKGKRGRGKYCMTTVNKTLPDNRVLCDKTQERIKNRLSNI